MDKIPLSEMLAELRKQLLEAQDLGKDAPLKFLIEDVELEVQLATTRGADGSVGVKFWVYNAALTHEFTLNTLLQGSVGSPVASARLDLDEVGATGGEAGW